MDYVNNLYKKYISRLILNYRNKTLSSSRINDKLLNIFLINTKFAPKNRNRKNFIEKSTPRKNKNFSMDSIQNQKLFELDKALTFKNMKLNFFKSKFPQIIQNNYKIYNKNENQHNLKKIKMEKTNENSMKSLSFHHKLLQMNKLKEILPIKKKDKQKIIENLKSKNNFKNGNGLIRSIIHINDKHSKSQVIKLPTLRIKTLDNDSEEDNDKFEQNFYNLIRKTQNRKGNRKSYDKIKSFNNPTKKVGTLLFNKKEKKIFEKKEKIPNKRKQIFHNEILYYSLK
jgi:hypothetical protein